MCNSTTTFLRGVVIPATGTVESTKLASGITVTALLLKRTPAPATPLGNEKGATSVPCAAVTTSSSRSTLMPQGKPGTVVTWNGESFVRRLLDGMLGYVENGWTT